MRKHWTDKEVDALVLFYPDCGCEDIAELFGVPVHRIHNKAFSMGLKKSAAFMRSEQSGRISKLLLKGAQYRFPKGHKPANKGKKWHEFMSEQGRSNSSRTTFKKGHQPHNTKEDGLITIRHDEGRDYKYIRLSVSKWIPLHVHTWEQSNGKVPDGYIVVFKDKNSMNCELSNLELITREENMKRNTWHRYPPELKNTIRTLNKLKKHINGKEQNTGSAGSSVRDNRVA